MLPLLSLPSVLPPLGSKVAHLRLFDYLCSAKTHCLLFSRRMQGNQDHKVHIDHGGPSKLDQEQVSPRLRQGSSPNSNQGSLLAKQWKLSQIMAYMACFSCFIVSARAFWGSGYRNCDNESPYGQAYRAGLYSGVTCVFAHTLAFGTWTDSRKIEGKAFLTTEAKQRRMLRMPVVVWMAAFLQFVAAAANGLAVYRALDVLHESRLVPAVCAIAVYVRSRDWIWSSSLADLWQSLLSGG